ncbi:MAG TPA: exopolysaccharide biosynthesis protein [Dongiaceae bacterium]|jgi:hypothetical protein
MSPDSTAVTGDNRRRASDILNELARTWPAERVSLGDIEAALGDRGFGLMIFVFTLPTLIPGIAMLAAIPLLLLAIQLMLGMSRPWLPKAIQDRSAAKADFQRIAGWLMPHLLRAERVLKPRLNYFATSYAERLIGFVCLVLILLLPLPWPFGNLMLAVPLILLALALIERDGLFAIAGLVLATISSVFLIGVTWVTVQESLQFAFKYLGM